jgi:hypothetical protein
MPNILDALDQAIAQAAPEERPALVVALAARLAQLGAALAAAHGNESGHEDPDTNISVEEAARRLGVSASYLYKNAKNLPFMVRIGRRRVCSTSRLERWNRARLGS